MENGAGGGGDKADVLGELGKGTLARLVEEALTFEGVFEPFKLQGKGANPFRHYYIGDEIEGAANFIEGEAAVGGYGGAVGQELEAGASSEHNAV